MNSKKLLDAFSYVDDKYLQMADKPQEKVLHLKKKMFTLIAAAICVSLLAATAIAQLPSIFQYLRRMDPENAPLYEAAEEANKGKVPEPVELPQLKDASLIVNQKYYDGKTILLGLNVKAVEGDPAIGFEPDADIMKRIRVFGHTTGAYISPQNADKISYPRYAGAIADTLRNILTDEEYEKVEQCMESTGHCCVVFREAFVGDHIYVNGVDTCATYDMDMDFYAGSTSEAEPGTEAIRLDPLFKEGQDQNQVTVELTVKTGLNYYYMDTEGHGYEYYGPSDSQKAEITILSSKDSQEAES